MGNQRKVDFDTIYTGDVGGYDIDKDNIPIVVELIPNNENIGTVRSIFNVNSTPKYINNIAVDDGELCIVTRNKRDRDYIDFEINSKGELIVHGKEASNYSIIDGELIYKKR